MNRLRRHWPILGLVILLLFVTMVRWRTRAVALERDEGEYAYAGQLMLQGIPPYRWIYNFKMPGIYAAYALIMALFGQTSSGIHLGFLLINLGAIVLIYLFSRRFLGPPASLAAAATFALLSLSQAVVGLAGHATHLVVLAALAGLILLLRGQEEGRLGTLFCSGALFGLAFLMKQPGGAFAVLGIAVLAYAAWNERPRSWKKHGMRMAVFVAGVAAPLALTVLWLWQAGVWQKFWFWTITYASVHATVETWSFGRERLALFFAGLKWDSLLWLWALAGLGCVLVLQRGLKRFLPSALLALSIIAVCPAFYFSPHYFVLLLPAIALLTGFALEAAGNRKLPWLVFILCWGFIAVSRGDVFLTLTPEQISDSSYGRNDFQIYPVVGDYLRTHTPEGASLAVFGSEPELLFYAHRRSATGYIYMYDLVEDQPLRESMQREMIGEVEKGEPDLLVFVNLAPSWMPSRAENFDAIQQWLMRYTQTFYVPFGVVTFHNKIVWGSGVLQEIPPKDRFLWLFKRRESARTP